MCGRFTLTLSPDDLAEFFGLSKVQSFGPRYNIAPSQEVVAIRVEEGKRKLDLLRWGLIPFWAEDSKIGYRTINARAETVHKSPAFRAAFRGRRCIIAADSFYEWDHRAATRQPYRIARADGKPLAFAGLWEQWEEKEGKAVIESCTIVTTDASDPVIRLHDRMPVILEPSDFDLWLDPEEKGVDHLKQVLRPADPGTLTIYPVSTYVNKATNEGERCIEPIKEGGK